MADRNVGLAIAGVASALVALFIGAGVILSLGHTVPTTLWSAASALSGALVGILIPPPTATSRNTKVQLKRQAKSLTNLKQTSSPSEEELVAAHHAIEIANYVAPSSGLAAKAKKLKDVIDATGSTPAQKTAAIAGASEAVASASEGANANLDLRVIILSAIGAVAFGIGIWLTFRVGGSTTATDVYNQIKSSTSVTKSQNLLKAVMTPTVHDTSWKAATDALVALGSAAGGALVGLLAPSPTAPASGPSPTAPASGPSPTAPVSGPSPTAPASGQ